MKIMLVNTSMMIPFIDQCFCLMAKYAHNNAGREKKEISNSDTPTGYVIGYLLWFSSKANTKKQYKPPEHIPEITSDIVVVERFKEFLTVFVKIKQNREDIIKAQPKNKSRFLQAKRKLLSGISAPM